MIRIFLNYLPEHSIEADSLLNQPKQFGYQINIFNQTQGVFFLFNSAQGKRFLQCMLISKGKKSQLRPYISKKKGSVLFLAIFGHQRSPKAKVFVKTEWSLLWKFPTSRKESGVQRTRTCTFRPYNEIMTLLPLRGPEPIEGPNFQI